MKRVITFILMPLFFTGCVLLEDDDKRTYYKKEGKGYVYYEHSKEPAPNVRVIVSSTFKGHGWATKPPIHEDFYTDNTGFFRIKFLKRTQRSNVVGITVYVNDNNRFHSKMIDFHVDKLDELILKLDTLWLR